MILRIERRPKGMDVFILYWSRLTIAVHGRRARTRTTTISTQYWIRIGTRILPSLKIDLLKWALSDARSAKGQAPRLLRAVSEAENPKQWHRVTGWLSRLPFLHKTPNNQTAEVSLEDVFKGDRVYSGQVLVVYLIYVQAIKQVVYLCPNKQVVYLCTSRLD